MSSQAKPIVLSVSEWVPSKVKYMSPKVNDKGAKSINVISTQSNRSLHISTPLMMTWGISDFIDDKGESDGRYTISLNFPNEEYKTAGTNAFLEKLKDFENNIIDDAVKNSEIWFGSDEPMSREVIKHMFFPLIKYSKNKDTKKIDYTKPPSIRAKVPFYDGKWGCEIYDTNSNLIFPCSNQNITPSDFVPKLSNVACVLQCGGIWIGGKGFGITFKLIQCVVKPRVNISVYGKCNVILSAEDINTLEQQPVVEEETNIDETIEHNSNKPMDVLVDDSDDEEEDTKVSEVEEQKEDNSQLSKQSVDTELVSSVEPSVNIEKKTPVKKVVKKAVNQPSEEPTPTSNIISAVDEPPKKKVVKKRE